MDKMKFMIYKIDLSDIDLPYSFVKVERYLDGIVNKYNESRGEDEKFKKQRLKNGRNSIEGYRLKLFYQKKSKVPEWISFLETHIREGEEILSSKNYYNSLVIFIYNKKSLYVISKGQGNFLINNYIVEDFGIEILSRIISPRESNIKSLSDISVVGNLLAEEKYYRRSHNILFEDTFGKVYKALEAELGNENLRSLGLNQEILRSVSCSGASSFSLKTSLTLDQLVKLISNFENVLTNSQILKRSIKKITKKNVVVNLKEKLNKKLETSLTEENYNDLNLSVIHSNFQNFFKASKYQLKNANRLEEIEDINKIDFLEKVNLLKKEGDTLLETIEKIKLISLDSTGVSICLPEKKMVDHFTGEIILEGEIYFLLDGQWYKINNDFVDELNEKVEKIREKYFIANILDEWINGNEGDYNSLMGQKENFISLDRCTLPFHQIEVFDLLEIKEDSLRLIHVKKGFNQNMRNLTYQAEIAAKLIYEDIKTTRTLSDKIFNEFSDNDKLKISKEKFKSLFYNPNLEITLAIKPGTTQSLETDLISDFNSSIAKYSLISVCNEIISREIKFSLTEN